VILAGVAAQWLAFSSGTRAGSLYDLAEGIVLGFVMCAVPYGAVRQPLQRAVGSGMSDRLTKALPALTRSIALVAALSISVSAVVGWLDLFPGDHQSLGGILSDAVIGVIAADLWWMWIPPGVILFVLLLSLRLIGSAGESTSSPWANAD
jgi:hypothetical protein